MQELTQILLRISKEKIRGWGPCSDIGPTLSAECGQWTWNGGSPQLYKVISKPIDHWSSVTHSGLTYGCYAVFFVVDDKHHLVWGPALIVLQCLGHVQDLTNHLLAFNTSERLSSPPHSFTHTWWWYWGFHIIGEITNTICNNCRPSRCDSDKEKLARWPPCPGIAQQDASWGRPSVVRVQVSFFCT